MYRIASTLLICVVVASECIVLIGCDKHSTDKTMSTQVVQDVGAISDLYRNAQQFTAKHVRVKGIVEKEDPKGLWIYLNDKTATIYVDVSAVGPAVKNTSGKNLSIEGIISLKENVPMLQAIKASVL